MNIETQSCTLEGVPAYLCWHTLQGAILYSYTTPGIASLDLGLIAIMPPACELVLPEGPFLP